MYIFISLILNDFLFNSLMKKKDTFLPDKTHFKHCALYEFNLVNNATQATNNICKVYGEDILKIRTCQDWFMKFRSGDFGFTKKTKKRSSKSN